MKVDEWELEKFSTNAPRDSDAWHAAAFGAAVIAFRRLQKRLPDRDLIWSVEDTPVGYRIRLANSITRSLFPRAR